MPLRAMEWGCGERWGEDPCGCKPAREGGERPSGWQCATGEREQTCVGASVPLEFITPCEPLSTEEPVADKGPFAGMEAHVGPQQGCLPESLAAVGDMAHVLLLALLARPGNGDGKEGKGKAVREEIEDGGRMGWREDVGAGQRAQRR